MKKLLLSLFSIMLVGLGLTANAQELELFDVTPQTTFSEPGSANASESELVIGEYTFKVCNVWWQRQTSSETSYMAYKKTGSPVGYMILPIFEDKIITNISLFLPTSVSAENTKFNIYVNDTNTGEFTPGVQSKYVSYDIPEEYQVVGATIKIESANNNNQIGFGKLKITYTEAQASDPRTKATLSFAETEVNHNLGETFVAPVLTADPADAASAVVYSSDNEYVATVVDNVVTPVGKGTATITASIPADNEAYKPASASYTLTVIDPNALESELTNDNLGNNRSSYIAAHTYTDEYGVTYSSVYGNTNNKIYFNAGNNNGGKGSQIVVSENNTQYLIKSIELVDATADDYEVYASDEVYDAAVPSIEPTPKGTKVIPTGTTYEINNKAFMIKPSKTSTVKMTKVVVTYVLAGNKEESGLSFGETTSFTAVSGTDFEAPQLTNPKEIAVTYSSSDESVATVNADGAVTLVGPGNTTITAKPADESKYYGSASYSLTVVAGAKSIAELIAGENNAQWVINFPMTVGFVNNKNVFATDGTDWIQIFNENSYEAGNVIPAGWSATYTLYNKTTPELKDCVDLPESTENAVVDYKEYTNAADVTVANVNEVLILKKVVLAEASPATKANFTGTMNGAEVNLRNNYEIESVEAGTYDIKVVCTVYNNAPSLYVIEFIPEVPEVVVGQVTSDPVATDEQITVDYGTTVTFTAENATKLNVEIDGKEITTDVDGDTYTLTAEEDVIITVTPYDLTGETLLEDKALMVMIYITTAPENAHEFDHKVSADGKKVVVSGVHEESELYYKYTPAKTNVTPMAVDHTGYEKATREDDGSHIIDTPYGGTLELYTYHPASGTKSDVRTIDIAVPTGVDDVIADGEQNGEVEYYNLQGVRVENPANGLYIRKQGSDVKKVLVK